MDKNKKVALQHQGLSREEAEVYLAGLELGETTVQNLAKKAGLKRPTTYKILDRLIDNGLFFQTQKGKKRYLNAEDPEKLKLSLKQREVELDLILPELKSVYNAPNEKPKIRFHEGLAGAISVYEDTLNSTKPGDFILNFTSIKNLFDIFPKGYAQEYFRRRTEKNITAKVIALDSEESREWKRNALQEKREIFLVAENQYSFLGDLEIYGDKVAFISYKENFMAIVIESRELANMQKCLFNFAWEKIKSGEKSNI